LLKEAFLASVAASYQVITLAVSTLPRTGLVDNAPTVRHYDLAVKEVGVETWALNI
jgi:hypothetical protein